MSDGNASGEGTTTQGSATSTNDGGKSSDDRTFTQADVERMIGERLTRERSKTSERYGDYDQLKAAAEELAKIKESQATETEKALKAAAKDTESRVRAELEPRMLRLEVALAKGLPEDLAAKVLSAAKRLVGTTREELEADAAEFFASAPITATTAPSFDQGARGGNGTARPNVDSGREMYRELLGSKRKT
jgi:hypothetical protein